MKYICTLLFFLACSQCFSQVHDYYVFLVKGDVYVSKPGTNSALVKQNSFLDNGQLITIKKDAEVTIVGREQEYYVLKSPGTYKVKDLEKEKPNPISGVTKTYLRLVWDELFHPHEDFKSFTTNNSAVVYGGVSRTTDCNNLVFPIPGLKTSGDSLHFKWHKTSAASSYHLLVYDSQRKEVVNMPVKDTQKILNLTADLHSIPGNYYWLVESEDGTCEDEVPVFFELMSKENEQKLIASILAGNNDQDLPGGLQAINKLEKNGLIPAAAEYYSTLVNKYPGEEILLKSYVLFLLKYGYDDRAYSAWQKIPVKK